MKAPRTVLWVATAALFVGCGGTSSESQAGEAKPLTALIDVDQPGLLGPFAKHALGATASDLAKTYPAWFKAPTRRGTLTVASGDVAGWQGSPTGTLSFDPQKRLVKAEISLPESATGPLLATMTKKWGEPTRLDDGSDKASLWLNEAGDVRVGLTEGLGSGLTIESVLPYALLASKEAGALAFRPEAVLGKTGAEILAAFPQYATADDGVSESTKKLSAELMKPLEAEVEAATGRKLDQDEAPTVELPPTPYQLGRTSVYLSMDDAGKVRQYSLSIDVKGVPAAKQKLLDALKAAWGEATKVDDKLLYFDAARGLRVEVEDRASLGLSVAYDRYLSYERLLEKSAERLAFKPEAVLWKTGEELLKAFPKLASKDSSGKVDVDLPPTTLDSSIRTTTVLHYEQDKVRSYGVMIDFPAKRPETAGEIRALIEKAWGKSKTVDKDELWYDAERGLRLRARFDDDGVDLDFHTYTPLAAFFGPPGVAAGFEDKQALLNATAEQLRAAYGWRFEPNKDKRFGSLGLDKTDYQPSSVETARFFLTFDKKGHVEEYRYTLPYEDYGPAKAEYLAALQTKYGAPKVRGRKSVYPVKGAKVSVEDSDITKELRVSVKR